MYLDSITTLPMGCQYTHIGNPLQIKHARRGYCFQPVIQWDDPMQGKDIGTCIFYPQSSGTIPFPCKERVLVFHCSLVG